MDFLAFIVILYIITFLWFCCRKRLFVMINNLPTIYEVVTGTAKKQTKEKTPKSSSKSNKSGTKVWFLSFYFNCFSLKWAPNFIPLNTYTATTPARSQLKGFQDATSKGWGWQRRRGRWGRGRSWKHIVWFMWRQLWTGRVLDMLWCLWDMVPWQMCQDHSRQSRAHQALQVSELQR